MAGVGYVYADVVKNSDEDNGLDRVKCIAEEHEVHSNGIRIRANFGRKEDVGEPTSRDWGRRHLK